MELELTSTLPEKISGTKEDQEQDVFYYIETGDKYFAEGRLSQAYEAYLETFDIMLCSNKKPGLNRSAFFKKFAALLIKLTHYDEALLILNKAIKGKQNCSQDSQLENARVKMIFGEIHLGKGEYPIAVKYFEESLDILLQHCQEEKTELARCYNHLGEVYREKGKFKIAMSFTQKAIEIALSNKLDDDTITAWSQMLMGNIYLDLSEYSKAEFSTEKALELLEKAYGKRNHYYMATGYDLLGKILCEQRRHDEAWENFLIASKIRKEFYGDAYLGLTLNLDEIANVDKDTQNYDEALKNYERSLRVKTKLLGENHPKIAVAYNNIVSVMLLQQDYTKAAEYINIALKIQTEFLEEDHPDLAVTLSQLGEVYKEEGDLEKAQENFRKAMKIIAKNFGDNHPKVALYYDQLGCMGTKIQSDSQFLRNFMKACRLRYAFFGPMNHQVLFSYGVLGYVVEESKDLKASESYNRKCKVLWKKLTDSIQRRNDHVLEKSEKRKMTTDLNYEF